MKKKKRSGAVLSFLLKNNFLIQKVQYTGIDANMKTLMSLWNRDGSKMITAFLEEIRD
jgi:hypothetical protein